MEKLIENWWKKLMGKVDGKMFSDLLVKNEEEAYEKNIEMSNNNDYTTGN